MFLLYQAIIYCTIYIYRAPVHSPDFVHVLTALHFELALVEASDGRSEVGIRKDSMRGVWKEFKALLHQHRPSRAHAIELHHHLRVKKQCINMGLGFRV